MILFVLLFNLMVCASSDQQLCDYFVVLPKDIERLIIDEYIVKNDTDFRDIKVGLTGTNKFWYAYTLTKDGKDTLQNYAIKQKIRRRLIDWLCNTSFDKIIDPLEYGDWYLKGTGQVKQCCYERPNLHNIRPVALECYDIVLKQWKNFMQLHRDALMVPDVNHVILCERNTNEYQYHTCLPDALEKTLIQIDTHRKKIIKLILPGIDYDQYFCELVNGQVPITHRIYGEQRSGNPLIEFFNERLTKLVVDGAILTRLTDINVIYKLLRVTYRALRHDVLSGYQRFIPKSLQYKDLMVSFESFGQTVLNMAAVKGDYEMVRRLLQHGADPNRIYKFEKFPCYVTPLFEAVYSKKIDVVKLLLLYCAKPNMPIYNGETPLMIAVLKKKIEIVQVLLDAGADVNARDKIGWTPLWYAIRSQKSEIIKLLLKSGADVNAVDEKGRTLLEFTRQYCTKKCFVLLEPFSKRVSNT